MNHGIKWYNDKNGDCLIGYSWEEEKVDWLACKGDSEELKEIKGKFSQFQLDKYYFYSPSEEIEFWGRMEKYFIYNQELKKKLWEILDEWFGDDCNVEHLEPLEPLEPVSNDGKPVKPIKPIKPIRPTRPFGKPKQDEKWKEYAEKMKKYAEEWQEYLKEKEDYDKKVLEYVKELKKLKGIREKQNDFGTTTERERESCWQ